MGTRNKKKINVERVGNSGHPITTNPTPVRHVMFQDKIPYTTFSNGTVVQSTVNKDGVNEQILRKSNLNPAYKLEVKHDGVSTPDTLGLYKANHPNDLWAYDKLKPGTKEYKEAVEKFNSYGIPLATYGEAYDNLKEVERQTQHLQPGGSIASRLWNKWTGKDTYTDGYGTTRHHVPVRESAHRTALKAADSPLVQAIPVVGDVADGYVAADYAAKGDYKPAMAAIGAGLVLPNVAEMGARFIPKQTWESALKKINDIDLEKTFKYEMSDETKKLFDDIKSGKKKLTKDMNDLTDNEKEQLLEVLTSSSLNRKGVGKGRIPSDTYHNFGPNDLDIDKVWLPEDPNVIGRADVGNVAASQSVEPWWGWDPVEYQQGGEIPSNDQQQQLFVAIITDMAKTLGVEPSQELAEAVMAAFENNDDSQGLLTLFTKTKDKFMNETGLFREGGKMIAFVNKFKCGGKAKKACKPKKKQEGGSVPNEETGAGYITTPVNDSKARRQWRERTGGTRAEARTTQKNLAEYLKSLGGITGRGARNSAAAMMGDPQRFAIPSTNPVLKTQSAQLNIENPQFNGIVPVNQDGGRVFGSEQYPHASRKEAIDAATDQLGFTRGQARMAYRNQKNALRNQGYSGNEMRQAARYNLIDQAYPRAKGPELPVLDENIEIDDAPIEINDSFVPLENEPINVKKIDTFGGSFNSAFGAARRSGLDEFTWNGKRYNTKLAPSQPAPLGKAQPIVNKIMTGEGDPAATKRSKSPWVWFPGRPSK